MVASTVALVLVSMSASALAATLQASRTCDVSKAVLALPVNQTALVLPTTTPSYVGLAFGTQNYTCSAATSTYTNIGAVADVYDISCLVGTPAFASVQDIANTAWNAAGAKATSAQVVAGVKSACNPALLGQHYFITNPITGTGTSPKWDFLVSNKGNAQAFVVGAKVGSLAAPTGSKDVDWLSLNAVQGALASQLFRVDTRDGQPPASCTPGSAPIQVKYTAKYWLYGGSVKK